MALPKDDLQVPISTGFWERHVLTEVFGIDEPLSDHLDWLETATHWLRIFNTPHGLAVLVPKAEGVDHERQGLGAAERHHLRDPEPDLRRVPG
jgi:hypothetical protein